MQLVEKLRGRHWTVGLLGAFAVLRIVTAVGPPGTDPDSYGYTLLNFLGQRPRLWTVPLIYNLLPANDLREAAQILIGIICWGTCALTVASMVERRGIRWCGMAGVLALGLVPQITMWDGAMLSESLDISLFVLLVALLLRAYGGASWKLLAGTLGVGVLWVFTRQENVLTLLALTPLLLWVAFRKLPRRQTVAVAGVLAVTLAWGGYCIEIAEQHTGIWVFNAGEVAVGRVAHDKALANFMAARGMNVALTREVPHDERGVEMLLAHPAFRRWIVRNFQHDYEVYLLQTFPSSVVQPWEHTAKNVSRQIDGYNQPPKTIPTAVSRWFWDTDESGHPTLALWFLLAAIPTLIATIVRSRPRHALMVLGLCLTAAEMAVVTYDLSTMEYPRLWVPTGLSFRLALLLGGTFAADAIVRSGVVHRALRRGRDTNLGELQGAGRLRIGNAVAGPVEAALGPRDQRSER